MIQLAAGDWTATVSPALGGSILGLEHAGRPVFRPTAPGAADILDTACFPLVPYANRIADGRFTFEGREVVLPVLPRFAPHALHGDAWLAAWGVDDADERSVRLRLAGGGDHWPWPWSATQTIALSDAGLRVELSMTNEGDAPAPAGLGLHPYFHRSQDARLTLQADSVWLTDAREIPDRLVAPAELMDWSAGPAVSQSPFVDHAYAGWSGEAVIGGADREVLLSASDNCRWTQVYAPLGQDFICVEPVTHRPDAVHAAPGEDSGLTVLAPGQTLSIWMTVGITG